jgi:hypothetical protein
LRPVDVLPVGGLLRWQLPDLPDARELPISAGDLLLGHIGKAPFSTDGEQYERWRRPTFVIDVAPGAAEGFSLEGLEGVHFVARTPSCSSPNLRRTVSTPSTPPTDELVILRAPERCVTARWFGSARVTAPTGGCYCGGLSA